jgi:hypothetical protein
MLQREIRANSDESMGHIRLDTNPGSKYELL